MGWVTSEDLVKWLIYVASLACLVVSAVFVHAAVMPWFYFRGYLMGYYSPLDYRMWYGLTGKPVAMPHTDYVRHATVAFTALSVLLLVVSVASLILVDRRLSLAAGAAYGASAGLVILNGFLYGYIYRATSQDVGMFSPLFVDEVTVRTLAGVVSYEGARVEQTIVYRLAFETPLVQAVLVLAVASSTVSVLLLLLRFEMERLAKTLAGAGRCLLLRLAHQSMPVVLASLVMLASVFTYYPSSLAIRPQPPPATLEPPPYAYTCTALARTARRALTHTDFETYPVPGWTSYGGLWELSAGGGFKGNALRGRDVGVGVGGASQYYWNTRIDGYASLWVSVKVRAEIAGRDGYKGIGLMNADRTRLYEASVNESTAYVRKWDGAWRLLGNVSVPGYSATRWYTLVLYYVDRGTSVDFSLWVYDDAGALVASLTTNDTGGTRFRPAYAGVTIDALVAPPRWFRFDDFIVSTVDPRSILFTGFYAGMMVEVWDNLGNLVASGATLTLGVVQDIVVGIGVDGRIVVRYPDAYLCGLLTVPTTDAVLGGDTYALSLQTIGLLPGANKTSATATVYVSGSPVFNTTTRVFRVNASQVLYARLVLENLSAPSTLNLDIWIEGATGSTSIVIRSGVPVTTSTSVIPLNTGLNNTLVLSGYTSGTATLWFKLELCTAPSGGGVCVYYPVLIVVTPY